MEGERGLGARFEKCGREYVAYNARFARGRSIDSLTNEVIVEAVLSIKRDARAWKWKGDEKRK